MPKRREDYNNYSKVTLIERFKRRNEPIKIMGMNILGQQLQHMQGVVWQHRQYGAALHEMRVIQEIFYPCPTIPSDRCIQEAFTKHFNGVLYIQECSPIKVARGWLGLEYRLTNVAEEAKQRPVLIKNAQELERYLHNTKDEHRENVTIKYAADRPAAITRMIKGVLCMQLPGRIVNAYTYGEDVHDWTYRSGTPQVFIEGSQGKRFHITSFAEKESSILQLLIGYHEEPYTQANVGGLVERMEGLLKVVKQ